jgi:hypothetical protein
MQPSSPHPCRPSSPAALGPCLRTPLVAGLLMLLASGSIASATRAEDKPLPSATVLPAVPLGAQQLADIAAKGIPNAPAPVLAMPPSPARNLRTVGPPTGLERIVPQATLAMPRRLPKVFEALGPIPRESWIRMALGKRDDVAVIGGHTVRIETDRAPR